MTFEFKHIDDYEILIPWDKQREGRDFQALVDIYFPENKDLIFCLLEMVTLSDLDAIGETYLYSTCTKKESKEILNQYKSIVNKVVSKFETPLAEYLDWYRRGSFILLNSNKIKYPFPIQTPNWEQEPSSLENEQDRSMFGKQIEHSLTDKQIQEYLKYYANLLHDDFGFKEYPHYCIIVRPISVIEGKEVIPLGNLYLHFATMIEKDNKFYLRLINDFLIVWFKKKGVKIIREIQHKTIEQFKSQADETKDYLPRFINLHSEAKKRLSRKLKPSNISLEDYYDDIFRNETSRTAYFEKLEILKKYLIPKFISLKHYLTNPDNSKMPSFSDLPELLGITDKFYNIQGQAILKLSFNRDHFEKTLIRREFFKVGFLTFEIEPNIIRNILMDAEIEIDSYKYRSSGANYTYLWTELFIPWKRDSSISKLRTQILDSLSNQEKAFLDDCETYLSEFKATSPNFPLT